MSAVSDARVIAQRMAVLQRNARDAISSAMDDAAADLLKESRKAAPQLTGKMIRTAGTSSDNPGEDTFLRTVFYKERYAVIQHEGFFFPGPVTQVKLGGARAIGRKFLQGPFELQARKLINTVRKRLEVTLRISLR